MQSAAVLRCSPSGRLVSQAATSSVPEPPLQSALPTRCHQQRHQLRTCASARGVSSSAAGTVAWPSVHPCSSSSSSSIGAGCFGNSSVSVARRRMAVVAAAAAGGDGDLVEMTLESVSQEEAEKYERIAAALVSRADALVDDDELLVDFGADVEALSDAFGAAKQRQREAATEEAAKPSGALALADATPRKQRRKKIPDAFLPKVAIVGRPNVGKSAMFNRICGSAVAVVYDEPGVTRDRLYTRAFWGDKEFVLIDTGGLMSDATKLAPELQAAAMRDISAEGLPSAIERQAAAGVAEADCIVFLADGQAGLQAGDREILAWLRQRHPNKKVTLAVNKCENAAKADLMAAEFWELGLTPHPVSAISGTGTGEMLDALVSDLPPPKSLEEVEGGDAPLSVAIVGRPNVGKSSLLNAICGEERSIVCNMSGTTRDAVDTEVTLPGGQKLLLVDTAGIRKRTKVADSKDGAEPISVDRAFRAMKRANVAVLVIDGSEGITQQDFKLSELCSTEGSAVVVVVNKWDCADQVKWTEETYADEVRAQLRAVGWATVVCTAAPDGVGVEKVVKAILRAGKEHRRRVTTATLNMVVKEATTWKAPPTQRGSARKGKIYYATQAGTAPPSFVFFVNDTKLLSDDYKRYMERQLRENIGFDGTPLRLLWRGKPEREKGSVRVGAKEGAAGAQGRGASGGSGGGGGRGGGGRGGGRGGGGGKGGRGGRGSGRG